ncbi:MAG TPA: IS110 family transposase [Candidatus Baltobacteraceae bacterium]|nr:IS110 family transposase [Candidatus Baltobacteraceae bacterium]HVP32388.1 IS110 family transposase [Steroidobacteraceae bacterium]
MKCTRVGLDIAKQVFQVHGVNERGVAKGRKTLPRGKVLEYFAQLPPCLIGIEACGSAHYWARELSKFGHTVKLMATQYVKAYRKRGKNDANDAEAICEAVGRPNMRFVAVKSEEQQAVLMVHRARALTVANRTSQVNQIRGLLGEFGLVVPRGIGRLRRELPGILENAENGLPVLAREVLSGLLEQLREADSQVGAYDQKIRDLAEASEPARRLMRVESIGPQTATALVATVGDPHVFKNGRGFAAWLGITPRQHSSGGTERLGPITRQGDRYLRTLLVHGARSYLRVVDKKTDAKSDWARRLKQRRHMNVAAVALAAKHARIAWAMLAHGTDYRPAGPQTAAA